jgi:hypothetical protein
MKFMNRLSIFSNMKAKMSKSKLTLLAVLACTSLAVAGEKVWYQGETVISSGAATLSAGAGTIVVFDDKVNGLPAFIGFAEMPKGTVQGKYGLDDKKKPENKGRIIYKSAGSIPYSVIGRKDIYMYHLKYLELTTVGDDTNGYRAYVTKAIAFDNQEETLSKTNTFILPEGGQLVVDDGRIKIGDNYITPNYDLSGKIIDPKKDKK